MKRPHATERVTAAIVRAQARALLRERVPFLDQVASGAEPNTRPCERATAQRILAPLQTMHDDDMAMWPHDP